MRVDKIDQDEITKILSRIKSGKWKLTQFADGKTNTILLCKNDEKKLVARVYGKNTENIINREKEKKNIVILSGYSMAPEVVSFWKNGYIIGYIEGRPLKENEMKKYYISIAQKMRKWHSIECYGVPDLFTTMLDWYWKAHVNYKDILEEKGIYEFIVSNQKKTNKCKIAFCHNDLLASNIIAVNEKITKEFFENQESSFSDQELQLNEDVEFIDYEYSGVNFAAFDIANHLMEYCGYSLNADRLPDKEFRRKFVKEYFHDISDVNNLIIDDFCKEVELFIPISNCFWALWALLKDQSKDRDFDYLKYAKFKLSLI